MMHAKFGFYAAFAWFAMAVSSSAIAQDYLQKSPEGAKTYIIEPANGAEVSSPFVVKFGLKGMGIAPAGVEKANTGHHHLLINQKLEDYKRNIPADETHLHFGGGQTETMVTLKPGRYTLQLVLGDNNHIPHNPPVESETISILVK